MKIIFVALAALVAVGCTGAPQAPTSPLALSSITDVGPNGETLKVTAPQLLYPINGEELTDLDPPFEWRNASRKFGAGSLAFVYEFQAIAPGGVIVQTHMIPQGSTYRNRPVSATNTSFEMDRDLEYGTSYTYRVRARLGAEAGPWSTGAFKTFDRFTCAHLGLNPLAIIQCHRAQAPAGPLEHNALALFTMMRDVARDFNRVGLPGGPWGILRKSTGNNCLGYSCDIICRGQGADQEQFDILLDENIPVWGANLPKEGSRVDVCEYQF